MIAYLDSSVVLRVVLGQRGSLTEWKRIATGITSALLEVECLRTLDRLRLLNSITVEQSVNAREAVYAVLDRLQIIELTSAILRRSAQPMPAPLGTLDALHLASVELWRETEQKQPVIATHDRQLATAARAFGYQVIGELVTASHPGAPPSISPQRV